MQHLRKNNLIFGGIFVVTDFKPAWKLPPAARRRRTQPAARAGSAFPHKLRREIASGGSPAPNPLSVRAGSAFLHQLRRDIGSSVTQNTKINAEPSRRRGQAVHSHTNCGAILGPASSLVCPTGIEPAHIRSERIALSTELRTDKGGVIPPRTNFLKN